MVMNDNTRLRTRHLATKFFGADDMVQPLSAVPRSKYMYFARFVLNTQAATIFESTSGAGGPYAGLSFKIKTIDKPKIELNAVELNQYNRKRWAYTKTEYQPVNVRIFDTVDNKPLKMWVDYFTYYFGDSRANKSGTMNDQITRSTFNDGTGWGLRPLTEQLAFFSRLELYSLFGKKYVQTTYLNPKITMADWQQYDSSSSEPDELSLTLRYEAVEYNDEKVIDNAMAEMFGFNIDTKPLDPPGTVPTATSLASRPALFENTAFNLAMVRNVGTSVTNLSNSIATNFGLNSSALSQLKQTLDSSPKIVSPSTTTYDSGYFQQATETTLAVQSYSNSPNINQNILGIPSGSLPSATLQIYGSTTLGTSPPVSSSLSVYGSFNFGSN